MIAEPQGIPQALARALHELSELRQFAGPAKEYWPRLLGCLCDLSGSSKAVLLLRDPAQGQWKKMLEWPPNLPPSRFLTTFAGRLESVAERAAISGSHLAPLQEGRDPNHYIASLRLSTSNPEEACTAIFLLSEISEMGARESLLRLGSAADAPRSYLLALSNQQAKTDVEKLAVVLDLMVDVNGQKRFLAAALALCNGLATRLHCERVSLGWLEGGYVRLKAISRTEKFDRQMAAASALEAAMEEALDQDEEVVWPADPNANVITRDHETFARDQRVNHVCSVPLRFEDKAMAALTCERQSTPFTQVELQQLRLCADQASHRLVDLHRRDRWVGARLAAYAKEQLAKVLGPEHTWAKVLAVVIVALLAVLFFGRFPYRVEGNFVLRSDEVAFLTAPFDGFIHQVQVRAGDAVPSGGPILSLDTSDLRLEETAALADLHRFEREAEKARAAKSLAEMRISQAMAEQATARLDLVRYRLQQAEIKSPFKGVIVEGDLRERIGAPVKQGDALFKVARLDTLYVEAEVPEREVHEILQKHTGEIAFVSQPKLKFPVRIVTIEPAAVSKTEGNVFLVRCAVEGGPQPWWRPGMSGLCKLKVEKRTLFWILTHRTVDFLRLALWW